MVGFLEFFIFMCIFGYFVGKNRWVYFILCLLRFFLWQPLPHKFIFIIILFPHGKEVFDGDENAKHNSFKNLI